MNKRNTLVGPQLQRGQGAVLRADWKRAFAFLAAIILGAVVATQVLANSFHYHPPMVCVKLPKSVLGLFHSF